MSRKSITTKPSKSSFFEYFLVALLSILVCVALVWGTWNVFYHCSDDEQRAKMDNNRIEFFEKVDSFFENLFGKDGEDEKEVVDDTPLEYEGIKLSKMINYNVCEYIDFTIPYTWNFGKITVDDPATVEAIAVNGPDVSMTISLRTVEIIPGAENMKWLKEGMIYEYSGLHSEYTFEKTSMHELEAAIIQGTSKDNQSKMYVVIIPAEENSILITYSFKAEDWNSDLYFTTAISEMLEKRREEN